MTQQPISAAFLRGAVDLSSLGRPAAAPSAAGAADPIVTQGTDANFNDIVSASMSVPSVVVLWSQGLPASGEFVDVVTDVARTYEGRFQVVSVDVDANPGLLQAFQVQSVPVTLGLIQGQPVPLFAGVQSAEHVRADVDEILLKLAVQHGVTGRVDVGAPQEGGVEEEQPLPPLHQQAFEAIERDDLDGAVAAYQQALKENPSDAEASLGLAQVKLMQRTADADLQAARAAAAATPADPAQTLVADLDLLGGHVETRSAAWLRPSATPAGTSATPPASTCWSCSRSSVRATRASSPPAAP